jgi:superfamily II DNA helicase RecQ
MEKIKDTEFGLDDAQKALLVRLKEYRREQAMQKGIPVYLIATNAQLALMVRNKCTTMESLKLIKGFGKAHIENYGKGFTHIIKTFHNPA